MAMTRIVHEYQPVQNTLMSYLLQEYRTYGKRRQNETPRYERWEEIRVRCPEFTPKDAGPLLLRLCKLTTVK